MHEAAQLLLGTHDFRSFETDWPNKVTSIRTVFEIRVVRQPLWNLFTSSTTTPPLSKGGQGGAGDSVQRLPGAATSFPPLRKAGPGGVAPHASPAPDETGDIISLDIIADGFLYNMVRSIVGTLVNVGRHKWDKDEVARILEAQNRSIAGSTAPACGLFLVEVWYES